MLSVMFYCYAECDVTPSVIIISVANKPIMLSVSMQSVVRLSVFVLKAKAPFRLTK
jgi:hypothetical protein